MNTTSAARNQAYRRFVAVVLRLDVATLANELRAARLAQTQYGKVA